MYEVHGIVEVAGITAKQLKKKLKKSKHSKYIHTYKQMNNKSYKRKALRSTKGSKFNSNSQQQIQKCNKTTTKA